MRSLGSVHEAGCDAQTLQRRDCLSANEATLAHSANNNLSSSGL